MLVAATLRVGFRVGPGLQSPSPSPSRTQSRARAESLKPPALSPAPRLDSESGRPRPERPQSQLLGTTASDLLLGPTDRDGPWRGTGGPVELAAAQSCHSQCSDSLSN